MKVLTSFSIFLDPYEFDFSDFDRAVDNLKAEIIILKA